MCGSNLYFTHSLLAQDLASVVPNLESSGIDLLSVSKLFSIGVFFFHHL